MANSSVQAWAPTSVIQHPDEELGMSGICYSPTLSATCEPHQPPMQASTNLLPYLPSTHLPICPMTHRSSTDHPLCWPETISPSTQIRSHAATDLSIYPCTHPYPFHPSVPPVIYPTIHSPIQALLTLPYMLKISGGDSNKTWPRVNGYWILQATETASRCVLGLVRFLGLSTWGCKPWGSVVSF